MTGGDRLRRVLPPAVRVSATGALGRLLWLLYLPWRVLPLRQDKVVFISYGGGGRHEFSCNPKYVLLALRRVAPQLSLSWVTHDPTRYPELAELGVQALKHGSPAAIRTLLTSAVVVSNGAYLMWFPFRRAQFVINTWHGGGAYKRLPGEHPDAAPELRRKQAHSSRVTSLFLSSCRAFTTGVIREGFGYSGAIAEIGLPRNDLLLGGDRTALDARTRAQLGLPAHARTVLLAPTIRHEAVLDGQLDQAALTAALERRFGGEWWVLHRAHKLSTAEPADASGAHWLDVADYPDMQELLSLADVLVSDYSSTIWDYSLTGKPCFLYLPDLAAVRERPGFYINPAEWGFPLAESNAALQAAIRDWEPEQYREAVRTHHRNLGSMESGRASEIVAERILQHLADGPRPSPAAPPGAS